MHMMCFNQQEFIPQPNILINLQPNEIQTPAKLQPTTLYKNIFPTVIRRFDNPVVCKRFLVSFCDFGPKLHASKTTCDNFEIITTISDEAGLGRSFAFSHARVFDPSGSTSVPSSCHMAGRRGPDLAAGATKAQRTSNKPMLEQRDICTT